MNNEKLIEHQKKVIDKLSRKIQKLRRWSLYGVVKEQMLIEEKTYWKIISDYRNTKEKISKALEYMKTSQDWDYVIIEKTINILEGKDENK